MQQLNLPDYQFNIKSNEKGYLILDTLRRRWVALTPEEWVRQNFVRYLIDDRQFPAALMNNEISLTQNGIKRRCDTLVADQNGNPLPYCFGALDVELSGELEIIGEAPAILRAGMGGFYVRTKRKAGKACVTLRADGCESVNIDFNITIK